MSPANPTEAFVRSLTDAQQRLFGYIVSLLGDRDRAADVLQECNLVLWRKAAEFREGADFIPWAFAIARYQVLAHLRDRKRDRLELMDPELADLLSDEAEAQAEHFDDLQKALQTCVAKLPDHSRDLLERRYFERLSIRALADETERGTSAIKVALLRIRRGLRSCIETEMRRTHA